MPAILNSLRPDHPNLATGLTGLAILYKAQGRYAEAEPLFKRALAIRDEGCRGPATPSWP